jgi:hypothetical protein
MVFTEEEAYNELCAYTLAHATKNASFIHQHVVDAYAAQRADGRSKAIRVMFALVGLYLHVERRFSGKQVQRVHMELARRRRSWPKVPLPHERGAVTAASVIGAPAGPERDKAIDAWCACVWAAYAGTRQTIVDLLDEYGFR